VIVKKRKKEKEAIIKLFILRGNGWLESKIWQLRR